MTQPTVTQLLTCSPRIWFRLPIRRNTGRGVCGGVISIEDNRLGVIGKVLAFVWNGRKEVCNEPFSHKLQRIKIGNKCL
ncbi:hypothetical protein TNCV_3351301 [Trichonephila clavipes]|nr:hypothetical protein TNCV_3351301 [Trichonephila clavipes]